MEFDLGGAGELESNDEIKRLLRHYDPVSGTWSLKAEGKFWEAVKIAHRANRTGKGTSIAILDGWIDETNPHLAKRIRKKLVCDGASKVGIDHGTVVALLISAAAPSVQIDFYGICDQLGRPQAGPIKHALELATASDVIAINISAGRPRTFTETLQLHNGLPLGYRPAGVDDSLVNPKEECLWCAPVDQAASQGKIIVAAVGNRAGHVFCPARSPNVIATGFHIERFFLRKAEGEEGKHEVGEADQPEGYGQSSEVAYTIAQPQDAIGSSFGAPLLTGALALGIPPSELPDWLAALFLGTVAHYTLASGNDEKVEEMLARAWSHAPHNHFNEPSPGPCFECSLFLEDLYTVESLHWLRRGIFDTARKRLLLNQLLMPWSSHAFVNFGNLLERLVVHSRNSSEAGHLMSEAARYYEMALDRYPKSLIAAQRLTELRQNS